MKRRIAIGRIIGLLLALFCISQAVHWFVEANRHNDRFQQWLTDRPMETAIDLSRPGETTAPFRQTCSISHGEAVFLDCDVDIESHEAFVELVQGLSATITITDAKGSEVKIAPISQDTVYYRNGELELGGFVPFEKGDYTALIRIESGAPALAGKRQTLYAAYQLCGLEQMPALIMRAVAVVAGVVGLISAACVLPGLFRNGIWRALPTPGSS